MIKEIEKKILTLKEAVEIRKELRRKKETVAITNGCFDILHKGHLSYLYKISKLGSKLIVGLNSDQSVKLLKGVKRPVYNQDERAFCLSCLFFVDYVVIFNEIRCVNFLQEIEPDIYAKGEDYSLDTLNKEERTALEHVGAKIEFIPLLKEYSTTKLIEKIKFL